MSRSTIIPPFDTTGLNTNQVAAVNSTAERLLVVAAAGAGKTRTLIARIKRMIHDGIDPRSIVVITFTVAASKVIQDRLGPEVNLAYSGTLHGFVLRILQQHGAMIGLSTKLTILDQEEAEAMTVEAIGRLAYKGTRKAVDEQVELGLDRWMPNMHTSGPQPPRGLDDAERVAYEYYWKLLTSGCLTFDLILDIGLNLIKKMAVVDIGQYQNLLQYQHLLVDEVNDSAAIDFEIYEALTVKTRFFCGDSDQRIMSFRNGPCDVFHQLGAGAPANGWSLLFLNDCYRCGSEIVEAANRLISHNTDRIPKEMRSATGTTGKVSVATYDTAAEELAAVAAQVKAQIAHGTDPNEIAVLCRTNALVADFRKGLSAVGIPVRQRKQQENPADWPAARAFIALLTNPENDRLALKFLELKLGKEKAGRMAFKAGEEYTTINECWLHIRNVQLQDVTTMMVEAKIERESVGRVRAMIDLLQPEATVLELQAAIQNAEEEANEMTPGVTIGTCHSVKGLEFQCVFICAVEEGIWPSKRELEDDDAAESRRLMYVAITRAKKSCLITWSCTREIQWKGKQNQQPSRFINEIKP